MTTKNLPTMCDLLTEIAERWRWGASLAGAPDKSWTERRAAKEVIDHLAGEGWQLKTLERPPEPRLSPDAVAVLDDGRRIGIEATELRDERSAERARAVKEGREAAHFHRAWDPVSLQEGLHAALLLKDQKRRNAILRGHAWGDPLDEYLVVVHTDELLISSRPDIADAALTEIAPAELCYVARAFFLIWYVPRSAGPRPGIYEMPVLSGAEVE